jgi:hypothetical protein
LGWLAGIVGCSVWRSNQGPAAMKPQGSRERNFARVERKRERESILLSYEMPSQNVSDWWPPKDDVVAVPLQVCS